MIPLRVSVDHILSWHGIYTSYAICCVACMTNPRATIPHVTITHMAKHAIAMNGKRVGTNVQLTFIIHQ